MIAVRGPRPAEAGQDGSLPPFGVPKAEPSTKRLALEIPFMIVTATLFAVVVKAFVAQAFFIPSESMVPQLRVDDRVVISKLAYRLHEPRRGDIVVFRNPRPDQCLDQYRASCRVKPTVTRALPVRIGIDLLEAAALRRPDDDVLIKRVIGLPGERIRQEGGVVFVDDRQVFEPYFSGCPGGTNNPDFAELTVPADRVWVMGDNRCDSADSRYIGPVKRSLVLGRAFVRFLPVSKAAFL